MPRAITYNCDICGAQRKEANHWFVAVTSSARVLFTTWTSAERNDRFDSDNVKYLCGQSCAHKLLDQFLQSSSESE
jgi:hypothetical protein